MYFLCLLFEMQADNAEELNNGVPTFYFKQRKKFTI